MTNLTSPDSQKPELCWHDLYHAALFETDHTKVLERIAEAERAILARVKERFGITSDHIEEDQVLDDALYALRALGNGVAIQAKCQITHPLRLEPGEASGFSLS